MERTGKRDAPVVDIGNVSGDGNKNDGTRPPPFKRIRESESKSSSSTSSNHNDPPPVDQLLKPNPYLLTLNPDFSYTDEDKAYILQTAFGSVASDFKWREVLDPELGVTSCCESFLKNDKKLNKCVDESIKTGNWDPPFNLLRGRYRRALDRKFKSRGMVEYPTSEMEATELSWKAKFMGDTPVALDYRVKKYFNQKDSYVNFCAIIQSSGMGKSRLVDEFSLTHIVIPIVLRPAKSTGYPPGDAPVVDYFEDADVNITSFQSNRLMCYFLTALLTETMNTFKDLGSTSPEELHKFFAEGMRFESHGKNRRDFYENVIYEALENKRKHQDTWNSKLDYDKEAMEEFNSTVKIFLKVIGAEKSPHPKAFFSFDEAHFLDKQLKNSKTHLRQLRKILKGVKEQPFFTFFISTTGKMSGLVSPRYPGEPAQLKRRLVPFYTDLGFDHLALENEIGSVAHLLAQVIQVPFMANFGRPMWALRAKYLPKNRKGEVLSFARMKLLKGENRADFTYHQKLACLSQRFALEYKPRNHLHVEQELTQVEGHLRVLLYIGDEAESIKSISSSEPLVAEAAALVMKGFNAPEAMKSVLEDFSINHGDRGELLVMLLLILARDAAIPKNPSILRIPDLICKLFERADSVLDMKPTISPKKSSSAILFKDMFKNAGTHFSHFIKVEDQDIFSMEDVLALMFRGAFPFYPNNTLGIDLCGAGVLNVDEPIEEANSFVFMAQIEDNLKYTTSPVTELFDKMDPMEILGDEHVDLNIPVIRIVFALASTDTALIPMKPRSAPDTNFTCYDIWCAGLSPEIYRSVAGNEATWKDLLVSTSWRAQNRLAGETRQQLLPGADDEPGYWNQWIVYRGPEHGPVIHPDDLKEVMSDG